MGDFNSPDKYRKLLFSSQQQNDKYALKISEDQADEIRDLCGEQLQIFLYQLNIRKLFLYEPYEFLNRKRLIRVFCSPVYLVFTSSFLIAMAMDFFVPTRTTNFLPRVIAV